MKLREDHEREIAVQKKNVALLLHSKLECEANAAKMVEKENAKNSLLEKAKEDHRQSQQILLDKMRQETNSRKKLQRKMEASKTKPTVQVNMFSFISSPNISLKVNIFRKHQVFYFYFVSLCPPFFFFYFLFLKQLYF